MNLTRGSIVHAEHPESRVGRLRPLCPLPGSGMWKTTTGEVTCEFCLKELVLLMEREWVSPRAPYLKQWYQEQLATIRSELQGEHDRWQAREAASQILDEDMRTAHPQAWQELYVTELARLTAPFIAEPYRKNGSATGPWCVVRNDPERSVVHPMSPNSEGRAFGSRDEALAAAQAWNELYAQDLHAEHPEED